MNEFQEKLSFIVALSPLCLFDVFLGEGSERRLLSLFHLPDTLRQHVLLT
jgi:hypothetical protein